MKVQKKKYMGIHRSQKEQFYVYLCRPSIRLNAGVRDWVLPCKYVFLETCENGDFCLIPTENIEGYKVSITNGQAKFSCCGLLAEMNVIERVRIPCEKLNDGKILCKASTVK
jgi:hypothetical protein